MISGIKAMFADCPNQCHARINVNKATKLINIPQTKGRQ